MNSDYAKKTSSTKVRVPPPKEEVYSEVEEEEAEDIEDEDYTPESGDDQSETDEPSEDCSGSEAEEDVPPAPTPKVSPAKALAGQKRKMETKKTQAPKRPASPPSNPPPPKKKQKTSSKPASSSVKETETEVKKAPYKEPGIFNDKNVDLDLYHSSPTNVVAKKIKISPSLIVSCRNIDQSDGAKANGQMYDFAALTFQRKCNNGKMFEFVIPLGLAPKSIVAIQHIVKANEKFFKPQEL